MFALKHEGVDLAVLNALFNIVPPSEIKHIIKAEPTGAYTRRLWFLYEWLTERKLEIPDAKTGNYVEALDSKFQFVGAPHGLQATSSPQ